MNAAGAAAAALALAAAAACTPEVGSRGQGLDAFCQAVVNTAGGPVTVDVETDYLPRVVQCENGAADQAALEAQAVAARSYLYYRLERTGDIGDGQSDQVYSCNRTPASQHVQAVVDTAGLVLRYPPATAATQVAAFYVAGALPDLATCHGGPTDPTSTERYVTYNEGLSGADVVQTTLGFVSPGNFANRGCMSQNGADCLSEQGRTVDEILRFYYGEDIVIERAVGPCVPEVAGVDGGLDGGDVGEDVGGCCGTGRGGASGAGALAVMVMAMVVVVVVGRRRRRR